MISTHPYFHERYEEKKEEETSYHTTDRVSYSNNHDISHQSSGLSIASTSNRTTQSVVSYIETEHARLRRMQRCIDKKDVKAAIKYGTRQPHIWGKGKRRKDPNVFRYTYNDIHYIVNETTKEEITCYAVPVTLDPVPTSYMMEKWHLQAVHRIQRDLDSWTSHTVMVVDTSGSMKNSDMWGSRNRLQGVWLSVALDFLAQRLESGTGTYTDVISIITMGDEPEIVFQEVPTSWVLYNEIVTLYNEQLSIPKGHGYFIPSLTVATDLLKRNTNASCAAALIFLSDGAPSDRGPTVHQDIIETVESLAQQFGRRLSFSAVGFGAQDDFQTLQEMVDTAKDYGTIAELKLPGMTSSSLGVAFTSIATSLTTTQTEMTDLGTMTQRKVRDVCRESRTKASQPLSVISTDDFYLYQYDRFKRKIRTEIIDSYGRSYEHYQTVPLQSSDAKFVAISKRAFGEGAERFAYRFYELASDGKTIVGEPMVAKESRMILDSDNRGSEHDARKKFVKTFIMTQDIASHLAKKFNEKLTSNPRIHKNTPKISFLHCSVYELDDIVDGKCSVLVENRLDHNKWYKWNSNNGFVNGIRSPITKSEYEQKLASRGKPDVSLHPDVNDMMQALERNLAALDLGKIEEGSDEEEGDNSDEETVDDGNKVTFTPSQVAQAFSHFSYVHSDRKRLVCDLQGVYDEDKNTLQLSDPVIHYYNVERTDRRCVHGRTDRGRDGIDDFFASHCCKEQGGLCQLVNHGFKSVKRIGRSDSSRRLKPL